MRALTAEAELESGNDGSAHRRPIPRRAAAWRTAVADWLTNLTAADEARLLLERRYLDGRGVLFPDLGRDWDSLRETATRLAGLAYVLPALGDDRSRRRGPQSLTPGRTAVASRAAAQAACLADTAREATLDLLGDTEGAAAMAERRLRSEGRAGTEASTMGDVVSHRTGAV